MKTIPAPQPDFESYMIRPDVYFAEREEKDSLEGIYGLGFSPYSGTKGLYDIFYNARVARIVLPKFEMTSENRRVAKKFDGQFEKRRIPFFEFVADELFYSFALNYFKERLGPEVMPRDRLVLILESGLVSTVVEYKKDAQVVGYVLEVESGSMRHYWYSAYDLQLAKQSLGLWLMLDCIRDAKVAGIEHYYLGTVYGAKALYKTNFEPLEWWDGKIWSRDLEKLKTLSRSE